MSVQKHDPEISEHNDDASHDESTIHSRKQPDPDNNSGRQFLAERYLDLWQANIKCWATDPDALDKWLMTISQQLPRK